jgi:hypothetical protein
VLRDRLGRHLVGLNVRRGTTLRVLGLPCLTRGLVHIVGASVEVLVGEVEVDLRALARGGRTTPDTVRAGDPKWCGGFPPPLRLSDRCEGDVGEGNRSQRTTSYVPPTPLHIFVYAQRDRGPPPSVGWRPRSGREIKRA